jgi:nucleotide-binding universal stress UspA family protein
MTYRTILVHIDNSERSDERAKIATGLAKRFDAHLIAIATIGFVQTAYYSDMGGYDTFGNFEYATLESNAELAIERFNAVIRPSGLKTSETRIETGDASRALCLHAQYSDLVLLGQHDASEPVAGLSSDFVQSVVLGCSRPVLVIPYAGNFETIGTNVLLLWNASKEAARATRDAMPFLNAAKQVNVAIFNTEPSQNGHGAEPGADIATYLSRHSVKVTVQRHLTEIDIGNAAISVAADYGSDLIVMGAYGHSRLREFVMGGVSRTIFSTMTVPVLLSH